MYGAVQHAAVEGLLRLVNSPDVDLATLNISTAANRLNVSVSHLQHLVRRDLDMCYGALIRRKRVERVLTAMATYPAKSLAEIGLEEGYDSLTMYRHFIMVVGVSPSAVRRQQSTVNRSHRGRHALLDDLVSEPKCRD